jgi:hypothetical protein
MSCFEAGEMTASIVRFVNLLVGMLLIPLLTKSRIEPLSANCQRCTVFQRLGEDRAS